MKMAAKHQNTLEDFLLMSNGVDAHLHQVWSTQLQHVVNCGDAVVQEETDVAF